MSVNAVTHINLQGQARQALAFYHAVFGGQIVIVTYQDADFVRHPSDANHVMWGQVQSDNGFRVMAYDVPVGVPYSPGENAYFLALRGETVEEITAHWQKLSEDAEIIHPLAPAKWSPLYGMLKDRFGVIWVVDVLVAYQPA